MYAKQSSMIKKENYFLISSNCLASYKKKNGKLGKHSLTYSLLSSNKIHPRDAFFQYPIFFFSVTTSVRKCALPVVTHYWKSQIFASLTCEALLALMLSVIYTCEVFLALETLPRPRVLV